MNFLSKLGCFFSQTLILFSFSSYSQSLEQGQIYKVSVKASNSYERSQVANFVHIDEFYENEVVAYVNYTDLLELRYHLYEKINFISQPYEWADQYFYKSFDQRKELVYEFPKGDELYHTYDEVNIRLELLAKRYPSMIQLINIGKSYENRDILGIKMTLGGFDTEMQKPAMMMMGSHHAREHLSTEVPLLLIDEYIKLVSSNKEFRKVLEQTVLYIIPLLNPDGALFDIKNQKYKMWRKNRRINEGSNRVGVDLNRNYSFGWGTGGSSKNPGSDIYMGKEPFSEPETQAIKRFVESHTNIKTMISFHTFSELILYPWGGTEDSIGGDDEKAFKIMAKKMATWNKYKPMQSSGLYVASGDTCDWAYGDHNIFCFTFELNPSSRLGGGFYPGAAMISKALKLNIQPTVYLLSITNDPYVVLKDSTEPDSPKPDTPRTDLPPLRGW